MKKLLIWIFTAFLLLIAVKFPSLRAVLFGLAFTGVGIVVGCWLFIRLHFGRGHDYRG